MSVTAHLSRVIQDQRTGRLVLGAQVSLCNPGTSVPITQALYSDEARTQPLPNPFTCVDGFIDVYLADRQTVALRIQYGTLVEVTDNLSVIPLAENLVVSPSPFEITNAPGTGAVLTGVDSATASWETPSAATGADAAILGWFLTEAFTVSNVVRDANGAMQSADVIWPDNTLGAYTADIISTLFPGKVDAWHVTRQETSSTRTFSQPEVTRDSLGDIITMPPVTIT